jgi:predicted HD superfamily hydrolase involved in NAD metabolism
MLLYEEINHILKNKLPSHRYKHTQGVVKSAIELSKRFTVDINKTKYAALIHDNAKDLEENELIKLANEYNLEIDEVTKTEPALLHALVGCVLAKTKFGVEDKEILEAIKYHTTGKANMNKLEKIIYLADYIEEGRNFPEVENIREAAKNNLDEAVLLALDNSIQYIIQSCKLIHPFTIEARNDLLRKIYYNKEKKY